MLAQMKLMMEYESPTLPQMIAALKSDSHLSESMHDTQKMPKFLSYVPETAEREEICTALAKNEDGFCNADLHKLKELFSRLGNSDRNCEQQRISAAAYYFEKRRETEQPLAEKRISLAKRLGVLGGIMAAVLMV
jgi:hypothetical protein